MDARGGVRIRRRSGRYTVPVTGCSPVELEIVLKCLRWLKLLMQAYKSYGERARPQWGKIDSVLSYMRLALYDDPIKSGRLRELRRRESKLRAELIFLAMEVRGGK